MGIEVPSTYGGSNGTFFSSILTVEELAKVDGSISVMCDIQNTLINTLVLQHGSEYLQSTYLPKLATNTVNNQITYQSIVLDYRFFFSLLIYFSFNLFVYFFAHLVSI